MKDGKGSRNTTAALTDKAIRAWLASAGATDGSDVLPDGHGLYLRRRTSGAFWCLRETDPVTKKRTWVGLFPGVAYPKATLAMARQKATGARLQSATKPTTVRRERVAALEAKRQAEATAALESARSLTVRQLFDRWETTELAPRVTADGTRVGRKDGGQYVRDQFARRVFPSIGAAAAKDVRKTDLLAILDAAKAEGKLRTANMLLADLKQMFRFALMREIVDRNPLDTVTKRDAGGKSTQRERVLSADEVKALAKVIPNTGMGPRSVCAVWLILATACRVGEAMSARWENVDLVERTWYLPETKNERPHTIHLSNFAVKQFQALEELRPEGKDGKPVPWVFPNRTIDDGVCIKTFGKQLADRQRDASRRMTNRTKNTEALKLPGGRWTAHDLRRTAATMMAEMGISGDVIDECLNHVIESRVRRTYIRDRRMGAQAAAFDALGVRLEVLTGGDPAVSNVVSIREAA